MGHSGQIVGFIGGSGFEAALEGVLGQPSQPSAIVATDYGEVSVTIYNSPGGNAIAFLPRHGACHGIAPHLINHHANIAALRSLGCLTVFSTTAVGSLRQEYRPGDIAVPDDFIDMRGGAPTTLYNTRGTVAHTDFSSPFDPGARAALLSAGTHGLHEQPLPDTIIHSRATYVCVNGPRYETPAEVRCFAAWGADLVGMTAVPEAVLARESALRYATLAVVTNYGTGIAPGALSHEEVEAKVRSRRELVTAAILNAANSPEIGK